MIGDLGTWAVYFAAGLLVYLLAYGPVDWSDAWVYVIAALWPAFLIWWALPYVLIIGIALVIVVLGVAAWESIRNRISR